MQLVTPNIYSNDLEAFETVFSEVRTSQNLRVGVIFEGGALRGILSCGYGAALRKLLPMSTVYALYGSSSGALNSIYFLTDQLEIAHSIYVENATDKRCTNVRNFPNILNVDWLLDNWIFGRKRFDTDKVHGSTIRTYISLTEMSNGAAKYVDATRVELSVLNKAMKATSYAPLLTNATQWIDGVECGDGAVADAVPYDKAVADGCTHIICLLTRPKDHKKGEGHFFGKWFKHLRLARQTADYKKAYWEGEKRYNSLMDRLYSGNVSVPTLVVSPAARDELPHNIETDPAIIDEKGRRAFHLANAQLSNIFPKATP